MEFAWALGKFLSRMSKICSKMLTLVYSACFGCHLCYHSNVKQDVLYWAIVLIIQLEEICEKHLIFFGLLGGGGGNIPLNARSSLLSYNIKTFS